MIKLSIDYMYFRLMPTKLNMKAESIFDAQIIIFARMTSDNVPYMMLSDINRISFDSSLSSITFETTNIPHTFLGVRYTYDREERVH